MRKVAILLVLLACDSESEDEEFRCRDWLVCYDECRAHEDSERFVESSCVSDCSLDALDDEIAQGVWHNDAWFQDTLNGTLDNFEPKQLYDALRDARRICYAYN